MQELRERGLQSKDFDEQELRQARVSCSPTLCCPILTRLYTPFRPANEPSGADIRLSARLTPSSPQALAELREQEGVSGEVRVASAYSAFSSNIFHRFAAISFSRLTTNVD